MALSRNQKWDWAKILYTQQGITAKEVCERVGLTTVTLKRWRVADGWDALRAANLVSKSKQIQRVYQQINAMNDWIAEQQDDIPNAKQTDQLLKLAQVLERLETRTGPTEAINAFEGFLKFFKGIDLDEAKKLVPHLDAYVKSLL